LSELGLLSNGEGTKFMKHDYPQTDFS
jgi:hypothetical protein